MGSLCSYPFVAIVMLSDTAGLVGGETLVKRGDGSVLPFAFPCAGSCLVMQVIALFLPDICHDALCCR